MNSSAAPWGSTWTANFPAGEVFSLQVTQRIMAGLGLLATVAMYVDYSRKPRQQTAANRLFLFASAADLLFHLMEIIGDLTLRGPIASRPFCYVQGFLITFAFDAMVTWSLAITIHCLLIVRFSTLVSRRLDRYQYLYHVVNWSLPLVGALVSLELGKIYQDDDSFDDNNVYCWISNAHRGYRIYLFYIPLWIAMVANVWINVYIIRKLKRARSTFLSEGAREGVVAYYWPPPPPEPAGTSSDGTVSRTAPLTPGEDAAAAAAGASGSSAASSPVSAATTKGSLGRTLASVASYPPTPALKSAVNPPHSGGRHPGLVIEDGESGLSGGDDSGNGAGGAGLQRRLRQRSGADRGIRVFAFRTVLFVVSFMIKWIMPTVNRLYLLWMPANFVLFWFQAFFISTGGLLNAASYFGFDFLFEKYEKTLFLASSNGSS